MNNTGRFALGAPIGLLVGSLVTYFSDGDKRKGFAKTVGETADKAKDSVVEGYYEAKSRYEMYRDKLKKNLSNAKDDAEDLIDDVKDKAKTAVDKGADKAKEVADKVADKAKE